MKHRSMACGLIALISCCVIVSCQRTPEQCKAELSRKGFALDQRTFLANVRTNDTAVVAMFLRAGMSANSEKGWPPLMVAASAGRTETAELLIRSGATIDATNSMGESALCEAAARGHTNAARYLIRKNADTGTASVYGWRVIHSAAKLGIIPIIRDLISRKADINAATVDGITPLMLAAAYGRYDTVRLLAANGARINDRAGNGMTAYAFATHYGYLSNAAFLKEHSTVTGGGIDEAAVPSPMTNGVFSARTSNALVNGRTFQYAVLTRTAEGNNRQIEAVIDTTVGGRIVSITVGGTELIYDPKPISSSYLQITGIPVLFPTPNRIGGSRYRIGDSNYTMRIATERTPRILHGIAIDDSWQLERLSAGPAGAAVTLRYIIDKGHPRFTAFPFPNILTLTYTVSGNALRIAYNVSNNGRSTMAYGFGVHPYFRLIGTASNILVRCDAAYVLDHTNFVPTGRRIPVNGTKDDMRSFVPLSSFSNDNALYAIGSGMSTCIRYDSVGLGVTMRASGDFAYMVRYNPSGQQFFALEHQTSTPDAHNIAARGKNDIARLISVAPGKVTKGHIDYEFSIVK
ncbi:MAG: ankyrin repeat domain-containing protein [Spirochaetes bacterium]|nr:ankyrin repeat domain-containing protein [Spirochaetota bacterium]